MLTQNLSAEQIETVNAISDNVEIIACAGAGKTDIVVGYDRKLTTYERTTYLVTVRIAV